MKKNEIIKYALINSIGTALYVIIIASFIYLGGQGIFGNNKTIFIPIAMLMLFVFSAAFTGSLMFGKSALWYFDGKKREALLLFIYTLGIFLILTVIIFTILIVLSI